MKKCGRTLWWSLISLAIVPIAAFATPRAGNIFAMILSRATAADPIHTVGHAGAWNVVLQTNGPSDFMVQYSGYLPGGYTGWHSHPGPVLVTVKRGTATWYQASDSACTPHTYPAGSAFVEPAGSVHTAQNESSTEQLELVTTYIVPVGVATRQDELQPAACPHVP
jgi:quercetin dioxygenase-like cupin family protein